MIADKIRKNHLTAGKANHCKNKLKNDFLFRFFLTNISSRLFFKD